MNENIPMIRRGNTFANNKLQLMTIRYYSTWAPNTTGPLAYLTKKKAITIRFSRFRHVSTLSLHHGHSNNQIGKCLFSPGAHASGVLSFWSCAGGRMERHRLHNRASDMLTAWYRAQKGVTHRPFVGLQCRCSLAITSNSVCCLRNHLSGKSGNGIQPDV